MNTRSTNAQEIHSLRKRGITTKPHRSALLMEKHSSFAQSQQLQDINTILNKSLKDESVQNVQNKEKRGVAWMLGEACKRQVFSCLEVAQTFAEKYSRKVERCKRCGLVHVSGD